MDDNNLEVAHFREGTEEDLPFIYSTWRNSAYYGTFGMQEAFESKEFFKYKTNEIKKILKNATILVCSIGDLIMGYSVYTGTHLYFVYVKADYRNEGLGTKLFPIKIETVDHNLTKIGVTIVGKKGLKIRSSDNES